MWLTQFSSHARALEYICYIEMKRTGFQHTVVNVGGNGQERHFHTSDFWSIAFLQLTLGVNGVRNTQEWIWERQ